jgi:hypothetical protein
MMFRIISRRDVDAGIDDGFLFFSFLNFSICWSFFVLFHLFCEIYLLIEKLNHDGSMIDFFEDYRGYLDGSFRTFSS